MAILLSIMHQGLIFSLVAMAVFITSRVINKDDLTVEGSFGFGGAITAILLANNCPASLSLMIALCAGALIGATTGLLFTRLNMNHLMAGLVSTTACFSISLALASANKNLVYESTIFAFRGWSEPFSETVVLWIVIVIIWLTLKLLLRSELGLLLRASGDNPDLLVHFGKSTSNYHIVGFSLANALTAIAGSLFVQWSGFFSITGNIGTLITGLASLMMAELVCRRFSLFIVIAAMVYQSVFAATLWLGVPPVWNNFGKASIIILLVIIARFRR